MSQIFIFGQKYRYNPRIKIYASKVFLKAVNSGLWPVNGEIFQSYREIAAAWRMTIAASHSS